MACRSIVIERLQKCFPEKNVSISYIYGDYKDRKTQTVVKLISSLVKQILLQQEDMPREIKNQYIEHKNGQISLSLEEYSNLLASLSTSFRRSFIVVDALDELVVDEDAENSVQKKLIKILLDLPQWNGSNGFALFFTSRHLELIQERLAKCARIEISAADSDIELYLRSRIRESSKFGFPVKVRDDAKFIDQIVSTLVENAQGMLVLTFPSEPKSTR